MRFSGTAAQAFFAACLAVGCAPGGPTTSEPSYVCEGLPPLLEPPAADACDASTVVDPDAIEDIVQFRRAASAVVCDSSLRCGGIGSLLAQSFCHPGFAERRDTPSSYDARAGRICLERLLAAATCESAIDVGYYCLDVSEGRYGRSCTDTSDCEGIGEVCSTESGRCGWLEAGDACTRECGPGLLCVQGQCRPGEGCSCEVSEDCTNGTQCLSGVCRPALVGETCYRGACSAGLFCDLDTRTCAVAARAGESCEDVECAGGSHCRDGRCVAQHHLGCACERDEQCPYDVARCSDGVCTARPMPGEPCDPEGPLCFASGCYDGVCQGLREGDGPCGQSADCAPGLSCSARGFLSGRCGSPRAEGEPCGSELPGACGFPLYCTNSDAPMRVAMAEVGESCEDRPCVYEAQCDGRQVCVSL